MLTQTQFHAVSMNTAIDQRLFNGCCHGCCGVLLVQRKNAHKLTNRLASDRFSLKARQ